MAESCCRASSDSFASASALRQQTPSEDNVAKRTQMMPMLHTDYAHITVLHGYVLLSGLRNMFTETSMVALFNWQVILRAGKKVEARLLT